VGTDRRPAGAWGTPEECLTREIAEELGCVVTDGLPLDRRVYEVLPARRVVIITYRVKRQNEGNLRLSHEHKALGFFSVVQIAEVVLPVGYRRAIVRWAAARDAG
jgi:8-oxo-dGTP pyrophosphatase MutT (NUDIX family)